MKILRGPTGGVIVRKLDDVYERAGRRMSIHFGRQVDKTRSPPDAVCIIIVPMLWTARRPELASLAHA